jgi:hypothetical protein
MMVNQCFRLIVLIGYGLAITSAYELDNVVFLPVVLAETTIDAPEAEQAEPMYGSTIPELSTSSDESTIYFLPLEKNKSKFNYKLWKEGSGKGMSKLKSSRDKPNYASSSPSSSKSESDINTGSKGKGASKKGSSKKGKGKGRYPVFSESPAPSTNTPSPTMADAANNATTPAPSEVQTTPPMVTTSPNGVLTRSPTPPPTGLTVPPTSTGLTVAPTSTGLTVAPAFPSSAPVVLEPSCYSNTTLLFDDMIRASSDIDNVYILCPNTVFNIGVDDENGVCCVDGMARLNARSRSHIKCGESGSSLNNCTLLGGQIQLLSRPQTFREDTTTDVVIQGITFEAATDMGAVLGSIGDLTFLDCIFKNHVNRAPVFVSYRGPFRRQRQLIVEHSRNSRALQVSQLVQAVTFTGCVFQGNQQGNETLALAQFGVVTAITEFNPLTFNKCVFTSNTFASASFGGYAIATGGSSLTMRDTCFYQNSFAGNGSIHQYGGLTLAVNNYALDNGSNLTCGFIAQSDLLRPESPSNITCIEADASTCATPIVSGTPSPALSVVAPSTQAPSPAATLSRSPTNTTATDDPLVIAPVQSSETGFTTERTTKSTGYSVLALGSCQSSRGILMASILYLTSLLL